MDEKFSYLIIGGGVAADAAARGIREIDAAGPIGIVSADVDEPYDRPPLSKYVWTDDAFDLADLPLKTTEATAATIRTEAPVTALDTAAHEVTTASGTRIGYEKLLLATGARPTSLPGLSWSERVLPYRSWADYRVLRAAISPGARVAIVGGGFIATELAASLTHAEAAVTVITPDDLLYQKRVPHDLARQITERYRDEGVELVTGARVESGASGADSVALVLANGMRLETDLVVGAIGVAPDTDWLAAAGIALDADNGGVVVDDHLATGVPDVWAAGDLVSYPDAILGRRRVEHVDHAQHSGRMAGRNMAGADQKYDYTPFFWSDLFDMGYEAIGELSTELTIAVDWATPLTEGVLFYLDERRVPRGIVTWNTYGRMKAARALLAAGKPLDPAALPTLPEDE